MQIRSILVPFALAITACSAPISETGRLRLEPHGMTVALTPETAFGWDGTPPVLEGATLCPRYTCARDCTREDDELFPDVSECFVTVPGGALELDDDGCFRVTGAGELDLALTPTGCDGPFEEPAEPDAFHLTSVSLASVRAHPFLGVERILLAESEGRILPLADVPDDLLDAEDRYAALAGVPVRLPVEVLRLDDAPVAVSTDARTTLEPAPTEVIEPGLSPLVTLAAGEIYAASTSLHGQRLDAGEIVGVGAANIASIELVPFFMGTANEVARDARLSPGATVRVDDKLVNLFSIRAVVRDDAGGIVHGVPVEWDLSEGAAVADTMQALTERHASLVLDEKVDSDVVMLSDLCRPPEELEGDLRWTVVARFGDVSASTTLELEVGPPPEAPDLSEEWLPSERCLGPDVAEPRAGRVAPDVEDPELPQINPVAPACGCEQAEPRGPALGLLALLFVSLLRRRAR